LANGAHIKESRKGLSLALIIGLIGQLTLITPAFWSEPALAADPGVTSEIDYYADFSGTGPNVTLASGTSVIPAGTNHVFTVEAWVQPKDFSPGRANAFAAVVTQNQNGGGCDDDRFSLYLHRQAGGYQVHIGADGCAINPFTSTLVPFDSWTHLAAVINGRNWSIYINGQLDLSGTADSDIVVGSSNAGFTIGSTGGSSIEERFQGGIDQVKVWGSALTEAQLKQSMHTLGAPAGVMGLRAHFDFNEGSGSTIFDRSAAYDLSLSSDSSFFKDVKNVSTAADGDTVVKFTRTYLSGLGGWRVPTGVTSLSYLAVGGGGAGGSLIVGSSGGGGGGQVLSGNLEVSAGITATVEVGAGGLSTPTDRVLSVLASADGQSSTFNFGNGSSASALGGGGGANARRFGDPQGQPSTTGWTGGGGSAQSTNTSFGSTGLGGETRKGGNPNGAGDETKQAAGGGGGASGAGQNAVESAGGNGGAGTFSSILGSSSAFGGGGGGGKRTTGTAGTGGSSVGGNGGAGTLGSRGLANSGGGGGGAGGQAAGEEARGGSGGSGIVVFRWDPSPIVFTLGKSTLGYGESTSLNATGGVGDGLLTYADSTGNCTVSGSTVTMKQNSSGSCTITATKAADSAGGYPSQTANTTIQPANLVMLSNFSTSISSTTKLNPFLYVQNPTQSGVVLVASIRVSGSGTLTMGPSGKSLITSEASLETSTGFSNLDKVQEISLRGTAELLEQALQEVFFESPNTGGLTEIVLSVVEIPTNLFFNSNNGHYYQFSNSASVNWTVAKARAASVTLFGQTGYLATVTSAEENTFITEKTGGSNAWLGGSDEFTQINSALGTTTFANQTAAEGYWYWVTGPEKGTLFWDEHANATADGRISGRFQYWNNAINNATWGSEPNNSGSTEHYLQIRAGGLGNWNDLPDSSLLPFVIEFGGMGEFQRIAASVTATATIVQGSGAPTLLQASASVSHGTVTLSWTAPASNGGSEITDYNIEYRPAGGSWTSYSDGISTNTFATLTNLQSCISHEFRVSAYNGFQNSPASSTASATPVWGNFATLSGVAISSTNSQCVLRFTSTASNSWSPPTGIDTVRVLAVGGGGGGGYHVGSGGGGGGVIDRYASVVAGTNYLVAVGAGGSGGYLKGPCSGNIDASNSNSCGHPNQAVIQTNGEASTFGPITAIGGGRGGSWLYIAPNSGGSGGGASYGSSYTTTYNTITSGAGLGTTTDGYLQGYAGGGFGSSGNYPVGGGGGAGGAAPTPTSTAGNGGPGRTTTISGISEIFGGGGGGGFHDETASQTSGGTGGGGKGVYGTGSTPQAVQNGTTNTGGGGGGGGSPFTSASAGGNGGSGLIIIRQVIAQAPTIQTSPASRTVQPSDQVVFTVSSTVEYGALNYQWQESADGSTWTNVGTNSSSYTISSAAFSQDGYKYRVVVSATANGVTETVTSGIATLNVSGVTIGTGTCQTMVGTATGATITQTSDGGCLLRFTSTGANSWTVPSLVSSVEVLVVGAGGGGAGGRPGTWFGGGGGGGGGAVVKSSLAVTSSQVISLTVGSGGSAGAQSSDGANGGSSSFSSSQIVASGGSGGKASATSGVGGFGGSGGSGLGSAIPGASGGDGADGLASFTYQRPTAGAAANRVVFAGSIFCVGGGGGGGNRGVDANSFYYFQAAGGGCSADSLTSGGAGRFYNGSVYLGANTGTTNTGGGGGGGSYTSGAGSPGAAGADGVIALYFVPGAGSVALTQPANISYSANANVSITLTKESPGSATWATSNNAVCTVSGNNAGATAVVVGTGICSVTVTIAEAGGYLTASSQVSFQVDKINQAAPTWDNSSINAAFGSTVDLYERLNSPIGSNYSFAVTGAGCSVTGFNLTLGDANTTCQVTATALATSIYLPSTGTAMSVNVTKISQSALIITSGNSFAVNQTLVVSAAGGTGGGSLSYHVHDGGGTGCVINSATGLLTTGTSGICQVYAKRASSTNYDEVSSAIQAITINKVSQTLEITSFPAVTIVAGNTYTVVATASSQLSVVISILSGQGSVCSIAGSTVTFLSSGNCVIEASQPGDGTFLSAVTVSQTVAVGKANQRMTFSAIADQLWGSLAFSLSATVSSGLSIAYSEESQTTNDACDVTSTGIVTLKNVGVCAITATQAGNSAFTPVAITRVFNVNARQAGKPFIGSISFGDREVTALVYRPSYLGGGTIAAYEVRAYDSSSNLVSTNTGCPAGGATTSCTIIGLNNGESYFLTIAALTQAGTGLWSDSSSEIVPASNPEAVRNLIAIEGNSQLLVQWQEPFSFGGSNFFQYRIYWRAPGESYQADNAPGATVTFQSSTSYLITGLENGVAYDVKVVTATTINNAELQSNTVEVNQTPYTVPNAPQNVVAFDNSSTIVIAWELPTFDGGNAIDQYLVTKDGVIVCTLTSSTSTSCEIPKPGTSGDVSLEVKARNDAGLSLPASTSFAVTVASAGSSGGSGGTGTGGTGTGGQGGSGVTDPIPQPGSGGSSTQSPIGFIPRLPAIPVTESGPVGSIGTSSEKVNFIRDISDSGVVAIGPNWTIEIEPRNSLSGINPVTGELALQFQVGATAEFSGKGLKPNTVVEVWVFSQPTYLGSILVNSSGSFEATLELPKTLLPGTHTLQLGTLDDQGRLVTLTLPLIVQGKVSIGTFKGYLALYTQRLEGQRVSFKVAGKWIVQTSVRKFKNFNYSRITRFTGAGYNIIVDVYINKKFYKRFTTRTR